MTYMFSCWDLRLAQVGEAGSQLGAGEPILTGPTSRSAGPRGPHAPPSPGEDQGRRNWRETFHLYIEVTAKGGPTPGSSRPFRVRSVSKGAGRTAGHPASTSQALIPGAPPSSVLAGRLRSLGWAPSSAGRPVPSPGLQSGHGPSWPRAGYTSQPFAGKEFLTWHEAKQFTKTKWDACCSLSAKGKEHLPSHPSGSVAWGAVTPVPARAHR